MSKEKSQEQIYDAAKKVNIDRKSKEDMHKVISSGDVMDEARTHVEKSGLSVSDQAFGEVKKILQSSKKTDKSIEKLNPNNKKKPSMKDQMVSALLLMTPQLLGTAVGVAMGEDVAGYEGAIEGQKVGEGIVDRERDRIIENQKMQESEQEEMTPAQKVNAWSAIGRNDMEKQRLEHSKEKNVQIRGEQKTKIKQAGRSLNLREESMRKLTPKQQEDMIGLLHVNDILNSVEDIIDTRADLGTGPFVGAAKSLMLEYGLSDDMDFARMDQAVGLTLATNLKRYSGTAVHGDELARWEKILMSPSNSPKLFREKLGNFRRMLRGEAWRMQQVQQASGQYSKDYGDPKKFEKQPHMFDKHKAEKNMSEMTPKQQELLNKYQ